MTIDLDALEKLADRCSFGDPWYTEENLLGRQNFGQFLPQDRAFIAAANPATIKALIAELKEARVLLSIMDDHLGDDDGMWSDESTISTEWIGSDGVRRSLTFGLFRRIRAFLARNGKGEG